MSRDTTDEVTDTARRRLELLGHQLARAGVGHDLDREPDPAPQLAPEPGRHSRSRGQPLGAQAAGWLQDRLPVPLRGRVSVGSAHVAVVAVAAALALVVTAYLALGSRSSGEPVPVARPAAFVSSSPLPTASATTSKRVIVDVSGKVRRPGIAVLPAGSRVIDAIRKAGGARKGVNLTAINLARLLVDGEQILVGVPAAAGVASSAAADAGGGTAGRATGGLVNLNTATLEQLETLSGVGPVTAQKILDWRAAHGSFSSVDDLLEVDGIGEKTLAQIAPHVTL